MAVITLFGPPEPEDKNVIGTANAINYFPKLNLQGQLLWEQRPGLAMVSLEGWPYRCSPGAYAWENIYLDAVSAWEISEFTLRAPDVWIDENGEEEQRAIEIILPAPLTAQTIGVRYRNSLHSRLRLQVFDAEDNVVLDTLLPNTVSLATTQIENIASLSRIRLRCERVE